MKDERHLSQIVTSWSMVRGAADPNHPDRQAAQRELLEIYSNSIRRYLQASVRDQAVADEIYQNFALKLVRGDFASADQTRGRFRSFVKTILYRLIIDHHRGSKRHKQSEPMVADPVDDRADVADQVADEEFRQYWREGLLNYAWQQLEADQDKRGGIYYSLLKTRVEHPHVTSEELIDQIEKKTGTRPNSGSLRVSLHRARQKFADYLVDAVASSLSDLSAERLDDELIALNLKKYCAEAIQRRQEQ